MGTDCVLITDSDCKQEEIEQLKEEISGFEEREKEDAKMIEETKAERDALQAIIDESDGKGFAFIMANLKKQTEDAQQSARNWQSECRRLEDETRALRKKKGLFPNYFRLQSEVLYVLGQASTYPHDWQRWRERATETLAKIHEV